MSYAGGKGGYTKGDLMLVKDEKLFVYIGGQGVLNSSKTALQGGGYNGGGHGKNVNEAANISTGGGGSTDIRIISGTWSDFNSLKSRIMVAAGGGGACQANGGYGGGLNGGRDASTNRNGYGASQTAGGSGGSDSQFGNGGKGTFGSGGNGNNRASGGGGGYYGGGGGTRSAGSIDGAGAGGSSFISGYTGCNAIAESSTSSKIVHTGQSNHYSGMVFTNTQMIDGGHSQTQPNGSTSTGHSGNGYARITWTRP